MVSKICILILTHKSLNSSMALFNNYAHVNFYIHVDLKSNFIEIYEDIKNLDNVFFIDNRVDVKWAAFSMVQATINLINFALNHDEENEYFHLISGDDVALMLPESLSWNDDRIFMECYNSYSHRYRMRFDTFHADTQYQRSFFGKFLTQCCKFLDKIMPTNETFYFGSQWFSIRRFELEIILNSITESDLIFFKKKLCPDEHFFQYLIKKNDLISNISSEGNKRFIVFDENFQRGSSPIFLNRTQLDHAERHRYWFARKVQQSVMKEYYQEKFEV
ncbi:beta-1,6-N-acetylglucosaminyltransferase [Acinetobacter ursingii]|uniref:beta-1,6-N-acetylglucosaminyltransferase n=1 Tax=Acinetobacter ursingii TaxID=108980 RepID=UPI001269F44F|nr:beta-1,6-N-acetylglucosaminyltransferase [Acinetobacter ursingii]